MWKTTLASLGLIAVFFCTAAGPLPPLDESKPTRIIKLAVSEGKVVGKQVKTIGGVGWIEVEQGEVLELRWSTDEHVTLQLHGFNAVARLPKGSKSTIKVRASQLGRFPVVIKTLVSEVEKDAKKGDADVPTTNRRMPFFVEVLPAESPS